MPRTLLAIVLLASAIDPSSARACSCVSPRLGRVLVPADGAAGFPTNGAIRVFLTAFPDDARASLASEYRLRDASGREVPLRASVERTRLDLLPVAALQPDTEYTIEQVFAYGPDGEAVTDTQRIQGAGGRLRGVWFPVSTFRTAAGPAAPRTITAALDRPSLTFRYGGGDCGPGVGVGGTARLSSVEPFDVLELHVRDQGVVATQPASAGAQLYASNFLCAFDPIVVRYDGGVAIELVARDASGAIVGRSGWVRPPAPSTPVPDRPLRARGGRWAPIPIVAAPPATSSAGPAACPYGFEVAAASVASSAHGPWMYGERSPLSADARVGWMAFAGDENGATPMSLVHIDASGATRAIATSVAGYPRVVATGADGALVASEVYTRTPSDELTSSTTLVSFAPSGAVRWSRALEGRADDPRIARGNGRLLVAWAAVDARYERTLSYAVLDERSGRPVRATVHTRLGIDSGESEAPAAAHLGDRFLLAWVEGRGFRTGPLRAMVVAEDGGRSAPIQLALSGRGMPDMVAASRHHHAGFVISNDGRIEWALLDRDGAVRAGPVVVSTGLGRDNRLPRIAYDGEIFAVAWETHPDEGVYVAAVDERGAVSPALRLDRGTEPAGTVGIAPAPTGFYAAFTASRERTELRRLVCRTTPPPGPAARIPPA